LLTERRIVGAGPPPIQLCRRKESRAKTFQAVYNKVVPGLIEFSRIKLGLSQQFVEQRTALLRFDSLAIAPGLGLLAPASSWPLGRLIEESP